jgi:hypothetical protein
MSDGVIVEQGVTFSPGEHHVDVGSGAHRHTTRSFENCRFWWVVEQSIGEVE